MAVSDIERLEGAIRFEIVDERGAGAALGPFDAEADASEAHDGIVAVRVMVRDADTRDRLLSRLDDTVIGSDVIRVHADDSPLRFRLIGASATRGDQVEHEGEPAWPVAFRAKQAR